MYLIQATTITTNTIETAYYLAKVDNKEAAELITKTEFPSAVCIIKEVPENDDRLSYLCTRITRRINLDPNKEQTA